RRRLRAGLFRVALILLPPLLAGCGGMTRNDNAEGVRLYQQGNYLGAVDRFQQALAQQPGSPDCFYNLGATYHQQAKLFGRPADLQTAEQYYHLCLDRNPNHEACQRGLAVLLVEEKRAPEAVAQLEAWAARQPTNPAPRIELARLCQEHGDLRDAENHLIDALAIDPNNTRALVALGQIRESAGNTSQAMANYTRALAIDPRQPVVSARVAALNGAAPGARVAALPPPVAGAAPPPSGFAPVATGNAGR
ncbi:MAG: tetratricopeptide repeat protein, partial [Planctomycetia bacterium]|nr:tetratricopeptide repeat protein [Planctomycetia bacterium]